MRIVFTEKDGVLIYKIIVPEVSALDPADKLLIDAIEKVARGNFQEIEKCRKREVSTSSPSR